MCRSFLDVGPTKPGRQTPSFPPPHWQRPAIKGGFAINPPTADAPRGQYTLLVLHPRPPLPPPPRPCQNTGGSEGLGGDRVSRHPSSTGLRFSPMATTPPPPPWVNIYFWQIQSRQEGNPLWPEKWDSAFLSFCSSCPTDAAP